MLEETGLERSAVELLQRLRQRHGGGLLLLRLPLREQALVLSLDHAHRVLENTPEPFEADSSEKRATLSRAQSGADLASRTLSALLGRRSFALPAGRSLDLEALPATFDHFSLTLTVATAQR